MTSKSFGLVSIFFWTVILILYKNMFNLDVITNEDNKDHNSKLPYIPHHPYRMLIIGGSGSGKANVLLNLIKEQEQVTVLLTRFICMLKT